MVILKKKNSTNGAFRAFLSIFGTLLIVCALVLLYLTVGSAVTQEVRYTAKTTLRTLTGNNLSYKDLEPSNEDFSIVIPKIEAVAPVFQNVDPFNSGEYLSVLRRGVAHAKGTPFPGQAGNTYIFAHSTDAFYNVGSYNAVFFLLGKLETGDEIYVYFKGKKHIYSVEEVKVVPPEALRYLGDLGLGKSLTLQTCYPPGTTLKRLVVVAKEVG